MSLKKGTKVERGYATVNDEDGVNYRDIAETLTALGHPMGHSSVRNYVIRTMVKFAGAISEKLELNFDQEHIKQVAMSPMFQEGIASILSVIEANRREEEKTSDN